jgi:hypothetical protein
MDALVSRIANELSLPHPRHGTSAYLPPTVTYTIDEDHVSSHTFPTGNAALRMSLSISSI